MTPRMDGWMVLPSVHKNLPYATKHGYKHSFMHSRVGENEASCNTFT